MVMVKIRSPFRDALECSLDAFFMHIRRDVVKIDPSEQHRRLVEEVSGQRDS